MDKEITIAGRPESEIRGAYFKGKLPQLLQEISADGEPDKNELKALALFLDGLQKEEKATLDVVREAAPDLAIGNEALHVPSLQSTRTPEQKKEFEKFFIEAEKAVGLARRIMFGVYEKIQKKTKLDKDFFLNSALEIAGLLHFIDGFRVYKDQQYREEMTRIIRDAGCSRKEAEEWAKTGDQYADYKRAVLFKEQIVEFILLCKKKAGDQQY